MMVKLIDLHNNQIDRTKYSVGELYYIAHLSSSTHKNFYIATQQSHESNVSQSIEVSDNHICSAILAIMNHLECVDHSKL
jgi:hypothetical protein